MLNGIRLRNLYIELQNELFYLIPEKWSKICLYASVSKKINNIETGEMFFYYFPKGILKKNPVNVYEVPTKFNIDEKSYLTLVDKLYEKIKELRSEFLRQEDELWSNITIIIANNKFRVIYNYEDLVGTEFTSYDRHIIWKYEYLDMPLEVLNKRDRKMLENYYVYRKFHEVKQEEYSEGMYKNNIHNIVEYNRENTDIIEEQKENYKEKQEIKTENNQNINW